MSGEPAPANFHFNAPCAFITSLSGVRGARTLLKLLEPSRGTLGVGSKLGIHDTQVHHTNSHRFVRFFLFTAHPGENRTPIRETQSEDLSPLRSQSSLKKVPHNHQFPAQPSTSRKSFPFKWRSSAHHADT